jgi:hypothetical protein
VGKATSEPFFSAAAAVCTVAVLHVDRKLIGIFSHYFQKEVSVNCDVESPDLMRRFAHEN